MDREMRKALWSRARYDWDTHEATRRRNAEQIERIPEPEFPATGTARISALLAEARRRRDEAYLAACTEGGGGLRTATPLDNGIEPAVRTVQPVADHHGAANAAERRFLERQRERQKSRLVDDCSDQRVSTSRNGS